MALSTANKHIVNRIRFLLWDKADTITSFEDKVSIIDSALSEYSDNVFNYRRVVLSPQADGKTYILPSDFENVSVARFLNGETLKMDEDFNVYEGKLVLIVDYDSSVEETPVGSSKIDLLYDAYVSGLIQEVIGHYNAGSNVSVTVQNSSNYSVGEYVLIQDGTEYVTQIKSIPDATHIVIDIVSNVNEHSFITGNAKIPENDWNILDEYARYKNMTIVTSDGKTSQSWTQGSRQETVNYSSGKASENVLESFYKRIQNHKNAKNKSFTGLQTVSGKKV